MKRNTLTTAVLAGLTGVAGMAGVANAVNVNPDGLGQVLLFPYYTARGGNDTLISITNTTERGKAVKIRFIEALNSREVLDFNIYMSPFDVWTAAVTATADGGAKMVTTDNTCTVPYIFGAGGEQEFLTFEFTGEKADLGPTGVERTASGYIEIIEMGTLLAQPTSAPKTSDPAIIPWVTKHVNGEPRNCDIPVLAWTQGSGLPWDDTSENFDPTFGFDTERGASGGLFGSASIINVAEGTMFSYNATAVDGFWAQGTTRHTRPDSLFPSLAQGNSEEAFVFNNGELVELSYESPLFGLNAVLAFDMLMNEYITDQDLAARTEWVLTFPTKRFHTDALGGFVEPNAPIPPFTRTWHNRGTAAAPVLHYACEDIRFRFWDREETEPTDPLGPPIVSPPPPPSAVQLFQLCREANVVRFGASGETVPDVTEILAEPARAQAPLGFTNFGLPYSSGWARFDLAQVPAASGVGVTRRQASADDNGLVVEGLPVIGFGVTTYTNGALAGGVLANYGGTFQHRGSRSIVVASPAD